MSAIEVSPAWSSLPLSRWEGLVLVVGASDSGKSTFARWLLGALLEHRRPVGWIDADVGQSSLFLPTTMSLAMLDSPPVPGRAPLASSVFVGDTTPRGHMLPVLVGLAKLVARAKALGARVTVIDSSGLLPVEGGGAALERWKVELLEPRVILGLERAGELAPVLGPFLHASWREVVVLPASPAVVARSAAARTRHRVERLGAYFAGSLPLEVSSQRLPCFDLERATPGRLVGLEDRDGLLEHLAIVQARGPAALILRAPPGTTTPARLTVGSAGFDVATGRELR